MLAEHTVVVGCIVVVATVLVEVDVELAEVDALDVDEIVDPATTFIIICGAHLVVPVASVTE